MLKHEMKLVLVIVAIFALYVNADTTYCPYEMPTLSYITPLEADKLVSQVATGENTAIKAYPGDKITFRTTLKDLDQIMYPTGPLVIDTEGSYKSYWTISNVEKASFSSSKTTSSLEREDAPSNNVYVYVNQAFSQGDSFTVTVTYSDDSTNGSSDGASCFTHTWTVTFKQQCPTTVTCIGTGDPDISCAATQTVSSSSLSSPAEYKYQVGSGSGYGTDVTIYEQFSTVTSSNLTLNDLKDYAKTFNSEWDIAKWKSQLFYPRYNGTFLLDSNDQFKDGHYYTPFSEVIKEESLPGLYYDLPQTYICNSANGSLNQTYLIRRKGTATPLLTQEISKSQTGQ